jgi:hypothetical protein
VMTHEQSQPGQSSAQIVLLIQIARPTAVAATYIIGRC